MFHDGRENGCNHTCMGALLVICKVNRNDVVQRILKVQVKDLESVVYQSRTKDNFVIDLLIKIIFL